MIKAVFLDIDDTLLDFEAYTINTLRDGFREFGLPEYEDWMLPIFHRENNLLWHGIEQRTITFDELQAVRFRNVFRALGIEFDGPTFETYFRKQLQTSAIPVEGAKELLEELKGKYRISAASNGPYQQQINRLTVADWLGFFDDLFISEKLGASKPSSKFYEALFLELEKKGVSLLPEEILMVGDSLSSDMAGAKAAGMHTCWFNRFLKPASSEVEFTIEKLSEVTGVLEQLNA